MKLFGLWPVKNFTLKLKHSWSLTAKAPEKRWFRKTRQAFPGGVLRKHLRTPRFLSEVFYIRIQKVAKYLEMMSFIMKTFNCRDTKTWKTKKIRCVLPVNILPSKISNGFYGTNCGGPWITYPTSTPSPWTELHQRRWGWQLFGTAAGNT